MATRRSSSVTNVDVVLGALEACGCQPRKNGAGYQARCPAHDDRNPSLSIGEGDDGRVLLHCHANCDLDSILTAINLDREAIRPASRVDDAEIRYRYEDETGKHLFDVVRRPGKKFSQEPANGARGAGSMKDVRRVPYHLPRVTTAAKTGATIYIVEGEKDVHAVERAGGVATTNPGGAGKWRDEYSTHLVGGRVVIIPDQDEPGIAHAARIAASLTKHGVHHTIAAPRSGKDAADHIGAGHTLDELVIDATPPDAAEIGDSWLPRSLVEYEADPPAPPAIGGALYAGKRHVLSGEPESGKSWLALAWCAEVLRSGGAAAYIDHEMGPAMTLERLRVLGLTNDDLERFRYAEPTENAILSAPQILELAGDATLVVIDSTIGSLALHDLDPNSGADIERWYQRVVDQLRRGGAAVVALDHVPKDPNNRGKFSIGSERKTGAADVHLSVEGLSPFGRTRVGTAKVVVRKDRPGHLARPTLGTFTLDPAVPGAYTWHPYDASADHDAQGNFRPTTLMERVSSWLGEHGPASRRHITECVTGSTKGLLQAVDALIREGFATEQMAIGKKGGGGEVHHLQTFVADMETTASEPLPNRFQEAEKLTVSPHRKVRERETVSDPESTPTVSRLTAPCPNCSATVGNDPYPTAGGTYCCHDCAKGDACPCKYEATS